MNKGANKNYLEDLNVPETKTDLVQLHSELKKVTKEPSYNGEIDLMLAVIENLQESLKDLKDANNLDIKKQARIFSDLSMVSSITSTDDEFDDEDDFDEDDLDEVEDES